MNESYEIVHLSPNAGRYLQFAGGEPSHNLLRVVHPDLRIDLRAALYAASEKGESTESRHIRVQLDGEPHLLNLVVRPLREPEGARGLILVVLREIEVETSAEIAARVADAPNAVIEQLEEALQRTHERLLTTVDAYETSIEELRAANEELQSISEEYQSTTEELETSKEELQSINEELTTVNQELKNRVEEVSRSNNDLQNLMAATDIGTLFVDRTLRVRRYTPPATALFNLIPTDVGRPLAHVTHHLQYETLLDDAAQVLEHLATVDREVQNKAGRWFLARLRPYRTLEERVDGVVITLVDITAQKESETALRESQQQIIETLERITDSFYALDDEWRFIYANPQAEAWWGVQPDALLGRNIWESFPQLRDSLFHQEHLRAARERQPVHFETLSPLLNRWIDVSIYPGERGLTVYFRDITARRQTEEALFEESEERYRTLFNSIDEGFCTIEVYFDENDCPVDYRFLDTNAAFERQTGLQNAKGRTARELVPNLEAVWFEMYGKVALTGAPYRFENAAPAMGRWFDVYAFRFGPPEAHTVAILFNDISARKQAEGERLELIQQMQQANTLLEEQRARLSFLAEASGTMLATSLDYPSTLENIVQLAVAMLADWASIHWLNSEQSFYSTTIAYKDAAQEPLATALRQFINTAPNDNLPRAQVVQTQQPVMVPTVTDEFLRSIASNDDHLALLRRLGATSWMTVPIRADGDLLGALTFISTRENLHYGQPELALAEQFAQQAAFAVENARLYRNAQQRLAQSREEERQMLARELHDGVVQQLIGLSYQLQQQARHATNDLADDAARVLQLRTGLSEIEQEVMSVAEALRGVIADLRPPGLEEYGLTAALEGYISQIERDHEADVPEITLDLDESGTELPLAVSLTLFRAAQEAIWNVLKHAHALHVTIRLHLTDDEATLTVTDDGDGFQMPSRLTALAQDNHFGLVGMSERVELVGGHLTVDSRLNDGTTLTVTIPLKPKEG